MKTNIKETLSESIHIILKQAFSFKKTNIIEASQENSPKNLDRQRKKVFLNTREVAMMIVWTALYAIGLLIPFSQYIGGPGFITLSIIFLPVYCKLLKPIPAMAAGVLGMLVASFAGAAIVPVYGLFSFAMPLMAGLLGSLAFNYRWGAIPGIIFLGITGYTYATYSEGTRLWLIQYGVAITAGIVATAIYVPKEQKTLWTKASWYVVTGCCVYLTTIIENATMNLGSVFIVGLKGPVWTAITPVSAIERAIVLIVAFIILTALWNRLRGKIGELAYI